MLQKHLSYLLKKMLDKLFKHYLKAEREKKILLAFEYGLNLSECAREMKIELTADHAKRAEEMIQNEFATQNASFLAGNMIPNLMTVFEFDISK